MSKEKKKVICDSCDTEFTVIVDSSKEIALCPFCGDEDVYVLAENDDEFEDEDE